MNGSGSGWVGALDRDLALLHRLEQRGLGLGRRPVDLVGQQQVGEHRALAEPERALPRLEDHLADHVGRHQVGGELHPLEVEVEGGGHRLDQQRLGRAGHALEQHVAAHEQGGDQARQRALLADHDLADLVAQGQDRAVAGSRAGRVGVPVAQGAVPWRTSVRMRSMSRAQVEQLVLGADGDVGDGAGHLIAVGAAAGRGDLGDHVGRSAGRQPEALGQAAPQVGAQQAGRPVGVVGLLHAGCRPRRPARSRRSAPAGARAPAGPGGGPATRRRATKAMPSCSERQPHARRHQLAEARARAAPRRRHPVQHRDLRAARGARGRRPGRVVVAAEELVGEQLAAPIDTMWPCPLGVSTTNAPPVGAEARLGRLGHVEVDADRWAAPGRPRRGRRCCSRRGRWRRSITPSTERVWTSAWPARTTTGDRPPRGCRRPRPIARARRSWPAWCCRTAARPRRSTDRASCPGPRRRPRTHRAASTRALVPLPSVEPGSSESPPAVGPPATSATTSRADTIATHSRKRRPGRRPGPRRRCRRPGRRCSVVATAVDADRPRCEARPGRPPVGQLTEAGVLVGSGRAIAVPGPLEQLGRAGELGRRRRGAQRRRRRGTRPWCARPGRGPPCGPPGRPRAPGSGTAARPSTPPPPRSARPRAATRSASGAPRPASASPASGRVRLHGAPDAEGHHHDDRDRCAQDDPGHRRAQASGEQPRDQAGQAVGQPPRGPVVQPGLRLLELLAVEDLVGLLVARRRILGRHGEAVLPGRHVGHRRDRTRPARTRASRPGPPWFRSRTRPAPRRAGPPRTAPPRATRRAQRARANASAAWSSMSRPSVRIRRSR